jgi:PAS domain S-box-containing protein
MTDRVQDYAIFLLDPDGHVISWNAGAQRIKQYAPEDIIGKHFSIFYTEQDKARRWPESELKQAKIEGRFEDEGWRVRKDGSRFWANVIITALRDESGQLLAYSKITRDLSERKKQEEELRESEERFRLLVDGVQGYAICMLSPEGTVTSWNLGARRIKGYEASEIIGSHSRVSSPRKTLSAESPRRSSPLPPRHGRGPVLRRSTAPRVSAAAPARASRAALSDIRNGVGHYASDRSWPMRPSV